MSGLDFRRWWRVPSFVLAASLIMTALAASIAHRGVVKRDTVNFHKSVDQVEGLLGHQLDTYVALLRGTAGLFAADEVVSEPEFQAFIARLDLRTRYPGIQGIGYSERVTPDHLAEFLARMRSTRPGFTIHPPPAAGADCEPVTYLEPQDERNRFALGYDMLSHPVRAAAMSQACEVGTAVASGRVTLVQEIDGDKQPGFLIYLPLYRNGAEPSSTSERRIEHVGFAYAPFRARDLVASILDGTDAPLDLEIYDGDGIDESALMYRPAHPARAPAAFEDTRPFQFAGHRWTVVYRSRPELLASRALVAVIAGGGLLASAMLFLATMSLARARERSELTAAELRRSEQALKRSEERLRFLADASAILGSSLEYQKTLANVASLAVPVVADWAAIDLLDERGQLQRLTVAHTDPAKVALAHELHRRWPPGPTDSPLIVIGSRQPLLVPAITDEMLAGAIRDPEHLTVLRRLGVRSALIVPLVARDRVLGALTFVDAESRRSFGPEDAAMAEDLARRSAAAIDNARLYLEAERASAALSRHADELARSNAELEQFAYVASHDLQEPLRMINNYLDLLTRRYGERFAGQPAEYMAFAMDGAKRMQALIKDLLSFSRAGRADEAQLAEVDAGEALGDALKNLGRAIEESGARVDAGPLPRVVFDRLQLLQLFQNLVGNAIKFHGEAPPRVAVAAERRAAADGSGMWEFSVRDNGIGIDPAHAGRVFEVFQRLHSRDEYPGTGIGLAICRKIVERRGGQIWVESMPGKGSTFRFTVPDARPATRTEPAASRSSEGLADGQPAESR